MKILYGIQTKIGDILPFFAALSYFSKFIGNIVAAEFLFSKKFSNCVVSHFQDTKISMMSILFCFRLNRGSASNFKLIPKILIKVLNNVKFSKCIITVRLGWLFKKESIFEYLFIHGRCFYSLSIGEYLTRTSDMVNDIFSFWFHLFGLTLIHFNIESHPFFYCQARSS